MKQTVFDNLVSMLQHKLTLKHTNFRPALTVPEQVAICLRFLATGDSFESLAHCFRVGASTVRKMVMRVCEAIWTVLKDVHLPTPTTDTWRQNAEVFEKRWGFPHCCGAIDGKHVTVFSPPNSGSTFFNYKGLFSIVLLAVADADSRFIAVDIGDFGSNSDGGVFRRSVFGPRLSNDRLGLSADEQVASSPTNARLPFVFVGDEAFPLSKHLMRPFPGRGLTQRKTAFNYHLSRARRSVECAFGILAQRFRIYHRKICLLPDSVVSVIKATVVLHNMLQDVSPETAAYDDEMFPQLADSGCTTDRPTSIGGCVHYRAEAMAVREAFTDYFTLQ